MGFYSGFVIAETGLSPPVTVDDVPQACVADNESKLEALDLVVFFAVKITPPGPTPALIKRDELESRTLQLCGDSLQRLLIGFDLELGLQRCRGR